MSSQVFYLGGGESLNRGLGFHAVGVEVDTGSAVITLIPSGVQVAPGVAGFILPLERATETARAVAGANQPGAAPTPARLIYSDDMAGLSPGTAPIPVSPGAPQFARATVQPSGQVLIEWAPPLSTGFSPVTGYFIVNGSGNTWGAGPSATSLLVSDPNIGIVETYAVAALNVAGQGPYAISNGITVGGSFAVVEDDFAVTNVQLIGRTPNIVSPPSPSLVWQSNGSTWLIEAPAILWPSSGATPFAYLSTGTGPRTVSCSIGLRGAVPTTNYAILQIAADLAGSVLQVQFRPNTGIPWLLVSQVINNVPTTLFQSGNWVNSSGCAITVQLASGAMNLYVQPNGTEAPIATSLGVSGLLLGKPYNGISMQSSGFPTPLAFSGFRITYP